MDEAYVRVFWPSRCWWLVRNRSHGSRRSGAANVSYRPWCFLWGQASFLTNFGRLGNGEGILSGFSQGLADPVDKAQIAHLLGHQPTGDAAQTAAEAIPKFKEFVEKTPDSILGKMLDALGYSKLGLGVEQARAVRGMSRDEVAGLSRSYREGKTGLGLDDKTAKKWTDFTTQMEKAGREIEIVFDKGLVKLTPGLTHLSDSFVHLVDNLLKDGSPIKGWIDSLGEGLAKFDTSIESKSFLDGADRIARDTTAIVRVVERMTSLSLKDVLAGMASGMDSSRADIAQRYGANWHWYSGCLEEAGFLPINAAGLKISIRREKENRLSTSGKAG
jgi:hypothetical protein